jgi:hypothetical protein
MQPLNVTYFKPFKNAFRKVRDSTVAKNKYLEPKKITIMDISLVNYT